MGWLISNFESGDCKVVYIDVSIIDPAFEAFIDNYIVDICFMDNSFSINKAKKYIRNFIDTKDPDREKGVVAEFFLHLYLNSIEMEQECLFKNLEENSPKKGFDGVYKDSDGNVWFIESKSGVAESCSHKGKVQEAYRDLKDKFSSTTKNDPCLNAYNHLRIINPSDSLLDKLDFYRMNEEEQRYVREGFSSDEELSMYDMLFNENLSKEDIKKIKKVAVDLLDKIKAKISELDHWTDKQETKAEVDSLIGKILWKELTESYSNQRILEYRKLIFEYVYTRYKQVA